MQPTPKAMQRQRPNHGYLGKKPLNYRAQLEKL